MSADTHESQEKGSDSVQLASQTLVSHFMVLGMEPESSERATSGLSHRTISLVPCRAILKVTVL